MNAEFMHKMLEAKRLEMEALAALVPPEARQAAAGAVRACADAALSVLETSGSPAAPEQQRERGARPIVIE
ncbi:hypothetical protein [Eggerthella sinensis]|uniref:hypothetical protein n=1 Tax=Eggerthella sinensis TaxID=242230 RepID=UPI001D07DBC6|nr:hypothetical protein [Eggerthella sinensis]MCB7036969.1 hypothetical protein [Eggerthella sinensis]